MAAELDVELANGHLVAKHLGKVAARSRPAQAAQLCRAEVAQGVADQEAGVKFGGVVVVRSRAGATFGLRWLGGRGLDVVPQCVALARQQGKPSTFLRAIGVYQQKHHRRFVVERNHFFDHKRAVTQNGLLKEYKPPLCQHDALAFARLAAQGQGSDVGRAGRGNR